MLTTAGATFLTSGAKVRPICSREVGTVCASTGPAANSRTAANARAQRRKRRSSIDEDLTRTAKGSRTPAASHLSPSCQGLARAWPWHPRVYTRTDACSLDFRRPLPLPAPTLVDARPKAWHDDREVEATRPRSCLPSGGRLLGRRRRAGILALGVG